MPTTLKRVALVAGASRGAGRGIAYALGDAEMIVYVTGRSTNQQTTDNRSETIEETASGVTARGGLGIPIVCDHTNQTDVNRLIEQIQHRHGQIDLLVNCVFGGSESHLPSGTGRRFWERPSEHWDAMMSAGPKAYLCTIRAAMPLLIQSPAALVVNLTSFTPNQVAGNLYYDLAMQTINRMTHIMAHELDQSNISVIALCPGFMRTERVVDAGFANAATESTAYIGRAIAALIADDDVSRYSGQAVFVADLAKTYQFTDQDGTQPLPF